MKQWFIGSWRRIPKEFWNIFGAVAASRLVLDIIGIAVRTHRIPWIQGYDLAGPLTSHTWLNVWAQWDTGHYFRLATHWYSAQESLEFAFSPLYPGLVRLIGFFTGHHLLVGVALANISLIIACWLLFCFVKERYGKSIGYRAVWLLLLFPSAFVLSGMQTEALFLALSLGCFTAAWHRRWALAGLLGLGLALTRPLGILITLPLLILYLQSINWNIRAVRFTAVWLLLPALGMVVWLWYNAFVTGDALTFLHAQAIWNRHLADPVSQLLIGLRADNWYDRNLALFGIVVIALLICIRRKISLAENVYAWAMFLVPLAAGLYSLPRYALVIFPLYIGVARLALPRSVWVIVGLALAILQLWLFTFWPTTVSWIV